VDRIKVMTKKSLSFTKRKNLKKLFLGGGNLAELVNVLFCGSKGPRMKINTKANIKMSFNEGN
jgi:hypothetical protein